MDEKQQKNEKGKKGKMNKEKKFYLFTAIGCAAVLVAIIVIALAVSGTGKVETPGVLGGGTSVETPDNSSGNETPDDKPNDDKPVVVIPEGMVTPVSGATVINDYGFFHNKTLNSYYEHEGMDFAVAAGTEVKAVENGVIESIYKADILLGTEIVVDHGDGLKTVYRVVTEAEGLKVGDEVEKGEVIATVAEATGNEYKDGAHLHFEVLENGKQVDPALHLPSEEK